jgi:excinuclease ABC subunit C
MVSGKKDRRRAGDKLSEMAPAGVETPDEAVHAQARSPAARARSARPRASLEEGVAIIRAHLATLPAAPGVYRMIAETGDALYVGKARDLKRRVTNYTQIQRLPIRLQRMVAETRSMEFVRTHTEVEALLLESNMIKRLMPRYNVLLRDDKSFPYIHLTGDHDFPQLLKHRGSRTRPGDYFGPFASAGAVSRTLIALQKAFMIRNCSDSVFATRTRPCLQFHIKRCTAPCVDKVSKGAYAHQIAQAREFLSGKSNEVQGELAGEMQQASERLDFETAAQLRDRIRALTAIQGHQDINVQGVEDADIVAAHEMGGQVGLQVFFVRGGYNYGNRAYFPSHDKAESPTEVLAAFLAQFYDNKQPPRQVLVNLMPDESGLLEEALTLKAGYRVELLEPQRGEKKRLIDMAAANAREALARRMAEGSAQAKLLAGVAELFGLDTPPERIEIYDNSHIQGTNAVGGMVVAGPEGFMKTAYRIFNIKNPDLEPGDDFGMMREVMTRRFGRAIKEDPDRSAGQWPDLVLIDGGLGQLNAVMGVIEEMGITDLPLVSIAKGPDRNAGREQFFLPGREPFQLPINDPVLYYLQRLRDEAHRWAIGGHRARRQRQISASPLDEIPGIGPTRKKALLHHFGSAKAVARAGLADLEAAPGISTAMARSIYEHFHGES